MITADVKIIQYRRTLELPCLLCNTYLYVDSYAHIDTETEVLLKWTQEWTGIRQEHGNLQDIGYRVEGIGTLCRSCYYSIKS